MVTAELAGTDRTHDASPLTGLPAGVVTRGMAYAIDVASATALYSAGVWGAAFLLTIVTGGRVDLGRIELGWLGAGWIVWWLLYFGLPVARFGRTPGKALLGLRVVRRDGERVGPLRATVRALAVPLLLAGTVGLDAVVAAVSRRRRAIHDHLCGTSVIYDFPDDAGVRRVRLLGPR